MAKNGQTGNGRSRVAVLPMTREELIFWFDEVILRLKALRRVSNVTPEFQLAIIDALERYKFSWSQAVLAERWLELGKWHEFRRGGELMITDFLPGEEQMRTIGELDEQISEAIMRQAAVIAGSNYIHVNRVSEMLSEVRIQARQAVISDSKTNTAELMQLLRTQTEEIERLKKRQKCNCSWRFHPRFNSKPLPRSRKF